MLKKLIASSLAALIVLTGLPLANVQKVVAAEPNLIANPSVETADVANNQTPKSWTKGYLWGDLDATYTYPKNGQAGTRSVKVQITRYNSGDAKWVFNPVAVESDTNYKFSDYYRSSVTSEIVAQLETASGAVSYLWLGQAAPATQWSPLVLNFKTPANTAKVSIYHLINKVGWLQSDNFSLTKRPAIGLIPNPSVEEYVQAPSGQETLPEAWQHNAWGVNKPTFQYLKTGHTGSRSVKVTMAQYQDGDAKWYYQPQNITPGGQYEFTDYYQSNVSTRVVVWVVKSDGTDQYLELRTAAPSSSWQLYRDTFTTPINAVAVSVLHVINSNGYLVTDDYKLVPSAITGFNRGLVSLTFDDGWESNTTTALPLLQQYGILSTQFFATGFINGQDYNSLEQIRQFLLAGHEIGSHSVTHPDLTTLSAQELDYELRASKEFLETNLGISVKNFASPFGAYNDTVINALDNYYQSHRSVNAGYNTKDNFDIYRLKVQNILLTTTAEEVEAWVRTAYEQKTWLILVYHKVDTTDLGAYDSTPAQLESHLQKITQRGIKSATVEQALNEIRPQL